MKNLFKIIGIIFLVIVVLIVLGIVFISKVAKERNEHYYNYTQTAESIEKKYTAMGSFDVSSKEYNTSDDVIKKIVIWYPTELKEKYPVVVWANGTGSKTSTYTSFFKHLASWGFIVVGNDDENTRTGESLNKTIDYLIQENNSKDSIFYDKLDLDNIGIGGHSQGGPAVFNMITNQEHGTMIKTIYAASPTSSYHTKVLGADWEYDISKVNVPTFLISGTGFLDAGNCESKDEIPNDTNGKAQGICPLWSLEENYNNLPDAVDKVIARKTNTDHGDSYTGFDGYMTAWFMYYLKNDIDAGKAFIQNGELSNNALYQDVKTNLK